MVNQSGDLVSNLNSEKVEDAIKLMRSIGQAFPIPNGLLLNYFLFNTNEWKPHQISNLDDLNKVKSMSTYAKEIIRHGCPRVNLDYLGQLVSSLNSLQILVCILTTVMTILVSDF